MIEIDLTSINNFFNLPGDQMLLTFLLNVGWIPVAAVLVFGGWELFKFSRQLMYGKTIKYTLLAIDVPRGNDISMRTVENLFTYLGGAHEPPDLIEKYWLGMYQLGFSFEIISIEGYIQYLVRTPNIYREIVESAIYSTYPDAEITEVNDYTEGFPTKFPDDEYRIWGGEFIQDKPPVYPMRTYKDFEYQIGGKPETHFKDPIATLMDLYTSMKKGEHIWLQFIVYPTDFVWAKKGNDEINKIVGDKSKVKPTMMDHVVGFPIKIIELFNEVILGWAPAAQSKEDQPQFKMMNLKPQQKKQIEAIQTKMGKLGFECKVRFAYVAKHEVFNRPKAIGGLIGWMKQFMDLDLNNLKPDMKVTATTAHYFFVDYRKNIKRTKLMSAYKDRTGTRGRKRYILTTDELATLWHFPIEAVVKAPLLQKSAGKRSEPPSSLPVDTGSPRSEIFDQISERENIFAEPDNARSFENKQRINITNEDIFANIESGATPNQPKGSAPANLPFVDQ